ncbi:MAG: response regulator [Anaerocolumna sp.]
MEKGKISVLIVDDETSIRTGLKNAINWDELGAFVADTFCDGTGALSFIEEYCPNIVITDIRMPGCDGLTLIEKTREKNLPVFFIIISGYDDFAYAQRAIKFGVTSYLLKPIKTSALLGEVKVLCEKIQEKQEILLNNTKIQQKLKLSTKALREQFIHGLLQQEYHTEKEVSQILERCNIAFHERGNFYVLIFAYDLTKDPDKKIFRKDDTLLFKSSVLNIIEELLGSGPNCIFIDSNDYLGILIQESETDKVFEESLATLCQTCIDTVVSYFNIPMWAGIGCPVQMLLTIYESYRTALECLSYRLFDTNQKIFDSSILADTGLNPAPGYSNNINNYNIIEAIYTGDSEEMKKHTDQFFESLFYIPTPPPSFIRGMCVYLIIDVQNGLSSYLEEEKKLFDEKPYTLINCMYSFSQIKDWITDLFTEYLNLIQSSGKKRTDWIIEKAREYIKLHIFQKITAENVAEYVHLSEKYFTNYFKEKTKENFKNYVLALKIDAAKGMLKTGEKSISEISCLIGYADYHAFNRIFKKYTGKTPSDYQHGYLK